ncbi:MAG: hypothetical protein ACE15C_07255 [Phycisphaerae bacterium]
MVILKIKQAQCALADGRLDEAFELLSDGEVRPHRQSQQLLGRLVEALVKRGQAHLAAGRLTEASADCDKAAQAGGNVADVAALRQAVGEAATGRQRQRQAQGQILAEARQHARDGRLTAGERLLDRIAPDDAQADALREQLQALRAQAQGAIARAESSLRQADWDGAIDAAVEARRVGGARRVADLVSSLASAVIAQARQALDAGRIDRAEALMIRLGDICESSAAMRELRGALAQCRRAADLVARSDPREAGLVLRQVQSMLPEATWVAAAAEQSIQAAQSLESLRAGPLGLLMGPVTPTAGHEDAPSGPDGPPRVQAAGPKGDTHPSALLPMRFFMHVDGVGSFLVLRRRRITVGPISSSPAPDVGLMADPSGSAWAIERADEDYFFRSDAPAAVNGKAMTSKLLADGDELEVSPRCRLRFGLPVAASTTAVLKLSGTALPGSDCRQVVLLDRDLMIGPGATCHVRVDSLAAPVVLYCRDGQMLLRDGAFAQGDGESCRRVVPGVPLCVGPLRLVLTEK